MNWYCVLLPTQTSMPVGRLPIASGVRVASAQGKVERTFFYLEQQFIKGTPRFGRLFDFDVVPNGVFVD
jgi:hypothetical protein